MRMPPLRMSLISALFGVSSLISSPAGASDFHSPRTAALGGAGHAGPMLNDAILLNPSFGAFLVNQVSAGGSYTGFDSASPTGPDVSGRNYQVSLLDGRSPFFQAGVAYTHLTSHDFIHIGAARALFQRTGIGLGAKFRLNPKDQSLESDGTLSVMGAPFKDLQLALVIDNVFGNPVLRELGIEREVVLGTKLNVMNIILLYIDPHFTPGLVESERWGVEAGAEFVVFDDFFLRVGTFRNGQVPWLQERGDGWGFGAGWLAPKISFDLGVSRTFEPVEAQAVNFGATIYL